MSSSLINQLIEAFRCLPGVGEKSARRMTYHILERDKIRGKVLSERLLEAIEQVKHCRKCRTLCEHDICELCSKPQRDDSKLCIVEMPTDVLSIEQTASFDGRYFVLLGRLSPLDGIGPKDIGLDHLQSRLEQEPIEEIIIATNPTVEGEATANYIAKLASKYDIKASRLAHGIPKGGELEYIDGNTLAHAISDRRLIVNELENV